MRVFYEEAGRFDGRNIVVADNDTTLARFAEPQDAWGFLMDRVKESMTRLFDAQQIIREEEARKVDLRGAFEDLREIEDHV